MTGKICQLSQLVNKMPNDMETLVQFSQATGSLSSGVFKKQKLSQSSYDVILSAGGRSKRADGLSLSRLKATANVGEACVVQSETTRDLR